MEQLAIPNKPTKSRPTALPTASQQLFVSTAITLTWQLFVVVLTPFLGGFWLDGKLDTKPTYTLVGLALALTMAAIVTYRAYQTLADDYKKAIEKEKHD